MTKTFSERCKMFEQCLPDASYRDLLKELHEEMLAKLAEQPAQQEPIGFAVMERPWIGLDDTDLAVCDTDGVPVARYWERVLQEKNT